MSSPPRTRDHLRTLERILALAEAYGCTDVAALEADVSTVLRVEYMTMERRVRSAQEHARRVEIAVGKTRHLANNSRTGRG